MQKSSFDALVQVIRALQTLEVPYMIVGAFSSTALGRCCSRFEFFPALVQNCELLFKLG